MKQKGIRQTSGGMTHRRRGSRSSARPKRASGAGSRPADAILAANSPPGAKGGRRDACPTLQIPDHELLRCIGRGSYGEVWLGRNVMGTYRAIKVVYRNSFHEERPFEREFAGIKKFEPISRTHPGFVSILHIGRNDSAGYFYYIMELADDSNAECGVRSAEC